MAWLRRIFGKTDEEALDETVSKIQKQGEESQRELPPGESDLDPATQPVQMESATVFPKPSIAEGVTQPLNPEILTPNQDGRIAFGQSTDVGLVRNNNQDAALSLVFVNCSAEQYPGFGLFVVADGMGGHHDGEKASAIATRVVASTVTTQIYLPFLSNGDNIEKQPISEGLISAVHRANHEVIRQVPEGGTTVTAAAVVGNLVHIVHVGDSRAYVITKDGIEQVTRDHSLVQRLIELDQLSREEAETHPQKNVLYRALGQSESLEVDTLTRRLPSDARLLLCSDGLWGLVTEQEIYETSMNVSDPQQACDKLVSLANTRGGIDNITAIMLRML